MPSEIAPHYDVVIIGAGPAGMTAAITLRNGGLSVAVFDEQAQPGGQIYRNVESADDFLAKVMVNDSLSRNTVKHGSDLIDRFLATDISYFPQSLVWSFESPSVIAVKWNGLVYQTAGRYVVLASGAQERPVPFEGWQLPGVMGVGAAQIMLKSTGAVPKSAPVLYGSGPLLYLYAAQLIASGSHPAAILDTTTFTASVRSLVHLPGIFKASRYVKDGLRLLKIIRASGVPHYKQVAGVRASGDSSVQYVEFTANGKTQRIETDLLLSHHGVIPELQLLRAAGVSCTFNERAQYWHPVLDEWGQSSVDDVFVCGDGAAINGAYGAEYSASIASIQILHCAGILSAAQRDEHAAEPLGKREKDNAIRPFLEAKYRVPEGVLHPSGNTIVCRCESVTAKQISAAVAQGCRGPNQVKTFTRCGMGACQGRMCGPAVEVIVASATGSSRLQVGHFRARPPIRPVSLGSIASLDKA